MFYNLGRKVGPKVRKAKWIWQSVTGTEADAIKVENEVGRDLAHDVRQQLKPNPDPEIEKLLKKIGPRLAACVANRYRTFSFEVVKGGEPNAFALPGGFIFITTSLVELCQADPDEVAFILAHEMAHVIRGHAMNRIMSNTAISTAARVTPVRGVLSGWLKKVGIQFLESAYSQDMESEADKLGARLAAAAKYDPKAATVLFTRLSKLSAAPRNFYLGKYFTSHP
ncbi:MAG: M48 family metallopeptidase, partial [Planctomycetota bacterium]